MALRGKVMAEGKSNPTITNRNLYEKEKEPISVETGDSGRYTMIDSSDWDISSESGDESSGTDTEQGLGKKQRPRKKRNPAAALMKNTKEKFTMPSAKMVVPSASPKEMDSDEAMELLEFLEDSEDEHLIVKKESVPDAVENGNKSGSTDEEEFDLADTDEEDNCSKFTIPPVKMVDPLLSSTDEVKKAEADEPVFLDDSEDEHINVQKESEAVPFVDDKGNKGKSASEEEYDFKDTTDEEEYDLADTDEEDNNSKITIPPGKMVDAQVQVSITNEVKKADAVEPDFLDDSEDEHINVQKESEAVPFVDDKGKSASEEEYDLADTDEEEYDLADTDEEDNVDK